VVAALILAICFTQAAFSSLFSPFHKNGQIIERQERHILQKSERGRMESAVGI
jgi:hypothetical protein